METGSVEIERKNEGKKADLELVLVGERRAGVEEAKRALGRGADERGRRRRQGPDGRHRRRAVELPHRRADERVPQVDGAVARRRQPRALDEADGQQRLPVVRVHEARRHRRRTVSLFVGFSHIDSVSKELQ